MFPAIAMKTKLISTLLIAASALYWTNAWGTLADRRNSIENAFETVFRVREDGGEKASPPRGSETRRDRNPDGADKIAMRLDRDHPRR